MSHGPTKIQTKGACIYCRRSGLTLTDEHVVPYFIGGKHVIIKASCLDCADITKRFEQEVARELWGDARISYNAPSRRKKTRQSHIILPGRTLEEQPLSIPYNEYPAPMIFYGMGKAGILQGLDEATDVSLKWQVKYIADDTKIKMFEKKYPGRLVAKFKHVPESFGRLIAKIGYGQVLCSLDPSDFEPICLPYIIGSKKNVSFIVGSGRDTVAKSTPGIGYFMGTVFIDDESNALILAEIRLLGDNGTPTYHVVIGTVSGTQNVERVRDKISATYMISLNSDFDPAKPLGDDLHWMPEIWPINQKPGCLGFISTLIKQWLRFGKS